MTSSVRKLRNKASELFERDNSLKKFLQSSQPATPSNDEEDGCGLFSLCKKKIKSSSISIHPSSGVQLNPDEIKWTYPEEEPLNDRCELLQQIIRAMPPVRPPPRRVTSAGTATTRYSAPLSPILEEVQSPASVETIFERSPSAGVSEYPLQSSRQRY